MQEKRILGALTMYRSRGDYQCRLEQYERAKQTYDMAYKDFPNDVRLLLARSKACSLALQPEQAFANADLALQLEPRNQTAVNVQARALYTMTDFERSLVMNHRGYTIRTQPPYFLEGINQGFQTIDDCIGSNSDNILVKYLPLIKKLESEHFYDGEEPPISLRVSRVPRNEVKPKLTQAEIYKHRTLSRVMAMKYLGAMADDKFYLQELVKDERLESANAAGARELKATANQALNTLVQRQNILRVQRPYYSIKIAEASESRYQQHFKNLLLKKERTSNIFTAKVLYKQLEQCLKKDRIDMLVKQTARMQTFLDMKTLRTLPSKDKFITNMYIILGQGFLSQYRLSATMSSRGNRRRVLALMNMPVGRPRSYDSVLCCCPMKLMSAKSAIAKYNGMLEICENATQRCWLYYELAKLMCTQESFSNAKFYAKHCMSEAKELDDCAWWVLGSLASLAPMMIQQNLNEIRQQVEITLPKAKETPYYRNIQELLKLCVEIASEPHNMDDYKANAVRQKEILRVMEGQVRVDQGVLFKRMLTLPSGRMLPVVPSREWRQPLGAERRRRCQHGLTVVPGQPLTLRATRKAEIRGYQYFDL